MTDHTPGPWTAGADNWVTTATDGFVAQCFDGTRHSPDNVAIGNANARLIAAAPDLLTVLRDVVSVMDNEDRTPEEMLLMEQAVTAISKATSP